MSNFVDSVITGLKADTENSLVVELETPEHFRFKSGQYVTLGARIKGREVYRTYSICKPAVGGRIDKIKLGIRVLPDGLFSSWLQRRRVGDELRVSAPRGLFYLRPQVTPRQENLFLAAGSGITPILSMAEDFLSNHSDTQAVLLYGNQSFRTTMFLEQLLQLKNRYLGRLNLLFFTSRENQDVTWRNTRLDRKTLQGLVEKGIIRPDKLGGVYLCGPSAMMEECQKFFLKKGVDPQIIFSEHFTPAQDIGSTGKTKKNKDKTKDKEGGKVLAAVTATLQGLEQNFDFKEGDKTLLQAAHRSGLNTPYACAGGMCGTCRAKLLQGEVTMEKNYALDAEDLDKKFVLTCQARPKTSAVKISFDY